MSMKRTNKPYVRGGDGPEIWPDFGRPESSASDRTRQNSPGKAVLRDLASSTSPTPFPDQTMAASDTATVKTQRDARLPPMFQPGLAFSFSRCASATQACLRRGPCAEVVLLRPVVIGPDSPGEISRPDRTCPRRVPFDDPVARLGSDVVV